MLEFAEKQGLTEVFLSCKKDNEASRKTILKNGGIFSRIYLSNEIEYEVYVIRL